MRAHVPVVSVAVISGLMMLACGSGPVESYSRKTSWSPPAHDPTTLQRQFVVPPDRSLQSVTVWATAPSPADATAQVRADIDALTVAVSDASSCTVHVRTYGPPSRANASEWRASAQLVLDVALVGATSAMDRMDRIDTCRGHLLPHTSYQSESLQGDREHHVTLHEGVLEIDHPESHLPALLERRARALRAVADTPDAPQLHPEDYRCVPTGHVGIGARTLEGVALQLDLTCRVDATPHPVPEG